MKTSTDSQHQEYTHREVRVLLRRTTTTTARIETLHSFTKQNKDAAAGIDKRGGDAGHRDRPADSGARSQPEKLDDARQRIPVLTCTS